MNRFYDWIAHYAERRPEHLAVHDLGSGRKLSYRALHQRCQALAAALQEDCQIEAGDRVAVLAHNSSDIFEMQFACWRVGAIFLPLNWRLAAREIATIVADAEPKLVIVDNELTELLDEAPSLPRLATDGRGGKSDYEAVVKQARTPKDREMRLADTGTLMYTAGTTGRSKGAQITHEMTLTNALNLSVPARITRDTVHLAALPLFHTGGLNCYANPVFHAGGTNVVMRSWDPAAALRYLSDSQLGLTHFFGVPAHFQFVSEQPGFAEAKLSLVTAGVGGAPCPLAMLQLWAAKGVPMQQGYGMTETSPTVLVLDTEHATTRLGSAGLPALHTEVSLRDDKGELIEGPDQVGEIWVRGPNVSPGYFRRPEANKTSYQDGWIKTGDAARRDADGFYYIVDRTKDMFISGGENVYPAAIENAIYELEGVVEVAVVGVPDAKWGEVGRAYVVPRKQSKLTEESVREHCRRVLAKFKVPKSVVFVNELPRNAAGKILKRKLRTGEDK